MTKYEWESELKKNIHRLPGDEQQRVFEYYNELFEDKIESGMSEREVIYAFGNPVDVADKILSEYYDEQPSAAPEPVPAPSVRAKGDSVPPPAPPPPAEWLSVPTPQMTAAQKTDVPLPPPAPAPAPQPAEAKKPDRPAAKGDKKPVVRRKVKIRPVRLTVFILLCIFLGGPLIAVVVSGWAALAALVVSMGAIVVAGVVEMFPSIYLVFTDFNIGLVQVGVCLAAIGVGLLGVLIMIKVVKLAAKLTKAFFVWGKNFFFTQKEAIYED